MNTTLSGNCSDKCCVPRETPCRQYPLGAWTQELCPQAGECCTMGFPPPDNSLRILFKHFFYPFFNLFKNTPPSFFSSLHRTFGSHLYLPLQKIRLNPTQGSIMPRYLAVSPSSGPPGTIWRTREEPSSSWQFTSLFSFSFSGEKRKRKTKTPFAVSLCGKHLQSWKSQVLTWWAEAGLMGRKPAVLSVARYANRYISTTKMITEFEFGGFI